MKFKAELEKDKSQLDSKEYEAKKANVADLMVLTKKKKAMNAKLEAGACATQPFGWTAWTANLLAYSQRLDSLFMKAMAGKPAFICNFSFPPARTPCKILWPC